MELATHATLVLVLGLAQPVDPLERLAHDSPRLSSESLARPPGAFEHESAMSPREAFLGAGDAVPVDEAIGRISCESIACYSPGVPALLPGERVSTEVVTSLRELTAAGARLHGAADPTFATVRVLVEDRR